MQKVAAFHGYCVILKKRDLVMMLLMDAITPF